MMEESSEEERVGSEEGPCCSSDDDDAVPPKLPRGQQVLSWPLQSQRVAAAVVPPASCPPCGGSMAAEASASVSATAAVTELPVNENWALSSSASSSGSSSSSSSSGAECVVAEKQGVSPRSRSRSPRCSAPASVFGESSSNVAGCFALPPGPQLGSLAAEPPKPVVPAGMDWWHGPLWQALLPHRMKLGEPKCSIFVESLCSGTAAELVSAQVLRFDSVNFRRKYVGERHYVNGIPFDSAILCEIFAAQ